MSESDGHIFEPFPPIHKHSSFLTLNFNELNDPFTSFTFDEYIPLVKNSKPCDDIVSFTAGNFWKRFKSDSVLLFSLSGDFRKDLRV